MVQINYVISASRKILMDFSAKTDITWLKFNKFWTDIEMEGAVFKYTCYFEMGFEKVEACAWNEWHLT